MKFWVAHAPRVLVLASRRNDLFLCGSSLANRTLREVRDLEEALARHAGRVRYQEACMKVRKLNYVFSARR